MRVTFLNLWISENDFLLHISINNSLAQYDILVFQAFSFKILYTLFWSLLIVTETRKCFQHRESGAFYFEIVLLCLWLFLQFHLLYLFFFKEYLYISGMDHISLISVFPLIFNFVLSYSWWTFLFSSSILLMFFCSIDCSFSSRGWVLFLFIYFFISLWVPFIS